MQRVLLEVESVRFASIDVNSSEVCDAAVMMTTPTYIASTHLREREGKRGGEGRLSCIPDARRTHREHRTTPSHSVSG